ncbi:MAG: hypothetical protein AB1414_00250 [bacterium]
MIDLKAVRPVEYLKEGFFLNDGCTLREGINGLYSLAMAYEFRNKKVHPEKLKKLTDALLGIVKKHDIESLKKVESVIEPQTRRVIEDEFQRIKTELPSSLFSELIQECTRWLINWRNFLAVIVHLQRINAQLALLIGITEEKI